MPKPHKGGVVLEECGSPPSLASALSSLKWPFLANWAVKHPLSWPSPPFPSRWSHWLFSHLWCLSLHLWCCPGCALCLRCWKKAFSFLLHQREPCLKERANDPDAQLICMKRGDCWIQAVRRWWRTVRRNYVHLMCEKNRTGRQEAEREAAGLQRPSSLLHIFKTVWRESLGIVPSVLKVSLAIWALHHQFICC